MTARQLRPGVRIAILACVLGAGGRLVVFAAWPGASPYAGSPGAEQSADVSGPPPPQRDRPDHEPAARQETAPGAPSTQSESAEPARQPHRYQAYWDAYRAHGEQELYRRVFGGQLVRPLAVNAEAFKAWLAANPNEPAPFEAPDPLQERLAALNREIPYAVEEDGFQTLAYSENGTLECMLGTAFGGMHASQSLLARRLAGFAGKNYDDLPATVRADLDAIATRAMKEDHENAVKFASLLHPVVIGRLGEGRNEAAVAGFLAPGDGRVFLIARGHDTRLDDLIAQRDALETRVRIQVEQILRR